MALVKTPQAVTTESWKLPLFHQRRRNPFGQRTRERGWCVDKSFPLHLTELIMRFALLLLSRPIFQPFVSSRSLGVQQLLCHPLYLTFFYTQHPLYYSARIVFSRDLASIYKAPNIPYVKRYNKTPLENFPYIQPLLLGKVEITTRCKWASEFSLYYPEKLNANLTQLPRFTETVCS